MTHYAWPSNTAIDKKIRDDLVELHLMMFGEPDEMIALAARVYLRKMREKYPGLIWLEDKHYAGH